MKTEPRQAFTAQHSPIPKTILAYGTSGQHLYVVVGVPRLLYPVLKTIHDPAIRKHVSLHRKSSRHSQVSRFS